MIHKWECSCKVPCLLLMDSIGRSFRGLVLITSRPPLTSKSANASDEEIAFIVDNHFTLFVLGIGLHNKKSALALIIKVFNASC